MASDRLVRTSIMPLIVLAFCCSYLTEAVSPVLSPASKIPVGPAGSASNGPASTAPPTPSTLSRSYGPQIAPPPARGVAAPSTPRALSPTSASAPGPSSGADIIKIKDIPALLGLKNLTQVAALFPTAAASPAAALSPLPEALTVDQIQTRAANAVLGPTADGYSSMAAKLPPTPAVRGPSATLANALAPTLQNKTEVAALASTFGMSAARATATAPSVSNAVLNANLASNSPSAAAVRGAYVFASTGAGLATAPTPGEQAMKFVGDKLIGLCTKKVQETLVTVGLGLVPGGAVLSAAFSFLLPNVFGRDTTVPPCDINCIWTSLVDRTTDLAQNLIDKNALNSVLATATSLNQSYASYQNLKVACGPNGSQSVDSVRKISSLEAINTISKTAFDTYMTNLPLTPDKKKNFAGVLPALLVWGTLRLAILSEYVNAVNDTFCGAGSNKQADIDALGGEVVLHFSAVSAARQQMIENRRLQMTAQSIFGGCFWNCFFLCGSTGYTRYLHAYDARVNWNLESKSDKCFHDWDSLLYDVNTIWRPAMDTTFKRNMDLFIQQVNGMTQLALSWQALIPPTYNASSIGFNGTIATTWGGLGETYTSPRELILPRNPTFRPATGISYGFDDLFGRR